MFRKNVASQFIHFQGIDAASGGIKTGVTWTVRRCIDGTFAAATGTVTEDGTTGWYKFAMSQADTNGNNIGFNFTGTGAVPQTVNIVTTAADPTDVVRLGLTALPNAAAEAAGGLYTRGTGAGQINQPANGMIDGNVVRFGGTAGTFASGRPEVNTTHFGGSAQSAADVGFGAGLLAGDGGTAQGGAAGSITLRAAASATDNLYRGMVIELVFGTGFGQSRVITGYTGATKVATVDEDWQVNPDSTTQYRMRGRGPKVDTSQQVTAASVQGNVTGSVASVTGLTASDVGAIKAKTDSLAFTVAGQVDANIQSVNDVTVNGDGAGTPWGP